jgi:creatinine amidohydrolase
MANPTPTWGRYAELRPDALARIRAQAPVAYLPWGALAWHGPHLPLGLEGTVAEAVAERSARRTGGALLPTTWWPAGAPPLPDSLSVRPSVMAALWDDLLGGLAGAGWRVAVLITGTYHPGHDLALMEAAERAIERHGLLTLATPPLAMVDEEMLDHGGIWETSLLMAVRPEQVRLDALGAGPLSPAASGVVGRDPRGTASASIGGRTLGLAVERISAAVGQLLSEGRPAPLHALYNRRRERYQGLIERHRADPDAITAAWWEKLTSPKAEG